MKERIFILCLWMSYGLNGQSVNVSFDASCESKLSAYNQIQRNTQTMKVYRIQFGALSDRREMESVLQRFKSKYDIETDWHQNGPYYYMKAGYYRSKMESYPDMMAIRNEYPASIYIVETVKKQLLFK